MCTLLFAHTVGNNSLQLTINPPGKHLTHTTGEELADGLSLSSEEVKEMAAAAVIGF